MGIIVDFPVRTRDELAGVVALREGVKTQPAAMQVPVMSPVPIFVGFALSMPFWMLVAVVGYLVVVN